MNISKSRKSELTGFQESAPYRSVIDTRTDFVMVYGIDGSTPERISRWRENNYVVHLMTGISWGHYEDYLLGQYDGREHFDEGQKEQDGKGISHGKMIPYMVPTIDFTNYLIEKLKVAVDSGVEAIHFEEPEFWARAGYSDAFKREWEMYYNKDWVPPHESPDAQYKASKLKAYLYTRTLDMVCCSLKSYAKVKYGRKLRCYVPTHSLINYSHWNIISPESNLISLPGVDGYIAQIWTGTSRTVNIYAGCAKERTFETSYLEYGVMQELVRGTGRRMWFLHDPIEDNGRYSWENYRYNYFKTLIASLLHHGVSHYEVCPWPNRVYDRAYPVNSDNKKMIPASYATELNIILNSLRNMEQSETVYIGNEACVGIAMADTAMYQRHLFDESAHADVHMKCFSAFYGIALPLLKHGLPIKPVQLDNIRRFTSYLDNLKMLVLSYEFIKPEFPDINNAISGWVRDGGVLVYVGDGADPYHNIESWWNNGVKKFDNPSQHLFEAMGVDISDYSGKNGGLKGKSVLIPGNDSLKAWSFEVGNGILMIVEDSPNNIAGDAEYADCYRKLVNEAMKMSKSQKIEWTPRNNFILNRGPYVIAACMDESVTDEPVAIDGLFVDLLNHELPVKTRIVLKPDENCLLYDVTKSPISRKSEIETGFSENMKIPSFEKGVSDCGNGNVLLGIFPLAGASRIELCPESEALNAVSAIGLKKESAIVSYRASGPERVRSVIRFAYDKPYKPENCYIIKNNEVMALNIEFDKNSETFLISFDNQPEGIIIMFA